VIEFELINFTRKTFLTFFYMRFEHNQSSVILFMKDNINLI